MVMTDMRHFKTIMTTITVNCHLSKEFLTHTLHATPWTSKPTNTTNKQTNNHTNITVGCHLSMDDLEERLQKGLRFKLRESQRLEFDYDAV